MTQGWESRLPRTRLEGARTGAEGPGLAGVGLAGGGLEAGAWASDVRRQVDAELARFLAERREATARIGGLKTRLVTAIEGLTLRGGKRLRPCVVTAAHRAVGGRPSARELERLRRLSAGLELMQTYLLVHDDWMDQDDVRRGGPSVHAALRAAVGDVHLGDSLAILAGDLASTYAWELVAGVAVELGAVGGAVLQTFARTQQEVVLGQELDLVGSSDVSRMQKLKTGSYTVEGPLRLGALLGGASAAQLARLEAFGAPLGEAFQIRDDLLGAYGDPARTGKPRGNDLRAGKRTALVREHERAARPEERAQLDGVLGRPDATEAEVAAVLSMLERAGVRDRVEQRLGALLDAANAALDAPGDGALEPAGVEMLRDLVGMLATRES
ncbi:MAG: polyprenyl synthetase family protein [Sandaracinaceae bacterium]